MKKTLYITMIAILIACQEKADDVGQRKDQEVAYIPASMLDKTEPTEVKEHEYLLIQGMIDLPPNHNISIQPYFEGFVDDVRVIEGSEVKKGDLLFKLVNPEFITIQEDYLVDKAMVEYLANVLARTRTLHAQRVTPDQDLEEMEMNYKVSKANLEAAKKTLKLMNLPVDGISPENLFESINVHAPSDGYVDELLVTAGEFINRGREAISIVNTDHVHIELNVFEKDLPHLKEGQEINFRIPELETQAYKAVIYLVGKSIDPQTRLVRVHAHLVDKELNLIPGMFVEAMVYL